MNRYEQLPDQQQKFTLLSGVSRNDEGHESVPVRLSFRGYFCPAETPEAVDLHSAVFPRSLFSIEQWDEQIFFGYEDAELCLRALRRGYQILFCPELRVEDTRAGKSVLATKAGTLTNSQIYANAARLYVGIKRYKYLFPNPVKLTAFLGVYFVHMTIFLLRKGKLDTWSDIIHHSHFLQIIQFPVPQKLDQSIS